METSPKNLYDLIAVPPPVAPGATQEYAEQAPEVRKLFDALTAKFREGTVDPLDLEQDLILMRAITINFLNRWDDFSNALISWYLDRRGTAPDKILDLSQAVVMLEKVSVVAERIHKMRLTTAINISTLQELQDKMALVLAKHVTDATVLAAIAEDWSNIDIDVTAGRRS